MYIFHCRHAGLRDPGLMSLFNERIDYFGPIEFNKFSVVTTVIKITLKVRFSLPHFYIYLVFMYEIA